MSHLYPFIAECKECGVFHVSIPLENYPVDLMEFSETLLNTKGCPDCGSKNLYLSQTPEAYKWYDENVRGELTND